MILGAAVVLVLTMLAGAPAPASAATTCAGKRVTLRGTDGPDVLRGTSKDDVIDGRSGADVISGLGGNDVICGGEGADDLRGNSGNDRLYGGTNEVFFGQEGDDQPIGDTLRGGPGDDLLVTGADPALGGGETISFDTATHGVTVNLNSGVAVGDGTDDLVLTSSTRLVGSPYADRLVGTPGSDSILGGAGADQLWGGAGADSLHDGSGNINRDTGTAADVLHGGSGNDRLSTGKGDDQLFGEAGDDLLTSEAGNDLLDGGGGDDLLEDVGRCAVASTRPDDRLLGRDGDDRLHDTVSLDVACGRATLDGGPGADLAQVFARAATSGVDDGLVLRLAPQGAGTGETEAGRALVALAGAEVVTPIAPRATVYGSADADFVIAGLTYWPWDLTSPQPTLTDLRGGGGDDAVVLDTDLRFGSPPVPLTYDGQDGTDCLQADPAAPATLSSVETRLAGTDRCPGWPAVPAALH